MSPQWHIRTESEEKILSDHDLIQQIHSGIVSIHDRVKRPEEESWLQISQVDEIVEHLLVEYIKNDCCFGPVTGKELSEYYRASKIKKSTPVRVLGQELWHHYSLICHVKQEEKQLNTPIPLPVTPDAQPVSVVKKWTMSDVMILSLSAISTAVLFACYYIHHP